MFRLVKAEKANIQKTLSISATICRQQNEMKSDLLQKKVCLFGWAHFPSKNFFSLNKQEFQNALALRYNFKVQGMPSHCSCGVKNSCDHAVVCRWLYDHAPQWGMWYTIMHHNKVSDGEADILREVCCDVQTEPAFVPLSGQKFGRSTNHQDKITRCHQG